MASNFIWVWADDGRKKFCKGNTLPEFIADVETKFALDIDVPIKVTTSDGTEIDEESFDAVRPDKDFHPFRIVLTNWWVIHFILQSYIIFRFFQLQAMTKALCII